MPHPDQKYIDALVHNDELLIKEIYHRYSGKIKWMVVNNHGTETDAADIFQEALLCIFNKVKTGSFLLTCPLDAFLYMICKRKWLNVLGKRKSQHVTFVDAAGYTNTGVDIFKLSDDFCLQQARSELLVAKMSELGEGCQQLLRLSWSGKSMEEVAGILKMSYGYARKKKSECMSKLVSLVKHSDRFNELKW